jgi:carboxyl-terminal processing protease
MRTINNFFQRYLAAIILIGMTAFISSCKEDDPSPKITNEENAYVNNWIKENMDFWYLWNDQIPANSDVNQAPDEYFESLLTSEDRFSWIQENYQELLNSLKGINKEAGYEFVLYKESASSEIVIAQILYVKPNSPASTAGLVRGDIITHVNDQQITTSNYKDLVAELKENHTIKYKSVNPETQTTSDVKSATVSTVQYTENPNFMNTVIDVDGRKIGYFIYNLFATGPTDGSTQYDDQMDAIFANFKSAGVTDLVLDLRFNSGGSESSAKNLASLIGAGVDETKTFARREYNPGVETEIKNDPDLGAGFLLSKFSAEASNIGDMLTDGRVYVLTSSRTASASELVINALKPFMDVFVIGDVTYGKNVGSISLYEENDSKNTWGMQPIVVKVYNSLDQSDYSTGFTPNVLDKDNSIYLYPLGDQNEALLRHAIEQITGVASGGRQQAREGKQQVGHSLDSKRGSYNLIIDMDPRQ